MTGFGEQEAFGRLIRQQSKHCVAEEGITWCVEEVGEGEVRMDTQVAATLGK